MTRHGRGVGFLYELINEMGVRGDQVGIGLYTGLMMLYVANESRPEVLKAVEQLVIRDLNARGDVVPFADGRPPMSKRCG